MAAFWRLQRLGRETGYRDFKDTDVVYLHFFPHDGFTADHLHDHGVLHEHQTIHPFCETKSAEIPVGKC